MNTSGWPEDNYYFNYGVTKILRDKEYKNIKKLIIVNLTGVNVAKLIKSSVLSFRAHYGIIIIYDTNQRPLADYLFSTRNHVIAIFPIFNCVLRIQDFLLGIGIKETRPAQPSLTHKEFQALNFYVRGFTATEHAEMQGINIKTVYTHRSHVIMKLGLRKLSDLFIRH